MTTIEDYSNIYLKLQLVGIDLVNVVINENLDVENLKTFNFNLGIQSTVEPNEKTIFVITEVDIKNDDNSISLGKLKASCVFKLDNFEELVSILPSGSIELPQPLINTLNMISVSTTRGVMFGAFRGTYLHNAILPIFDPLKFIPSHQA